MPRKTPQRLTNNIIFSVLGIVVLYILISKLSIDSPQQSFNAEVQVKETLDSVNMIYTNYFYGIAIDVPNHWKTMGVPTERKIITLADEDSATYIDIVITDIGEQHLEEKRTIWDIYDQEEVAVENILHNNLSLTTNAHLYEFTMKKIRLSNHEAIKASTSYFYETLDNSITFQVEMIVVLKDAYLFFVALNTPKILYDSNTKYYLDILSSINLIQSNRSKH